MSWSTVFGNSQRNSNAGVSTEIGSLLWTYTFPTAAGGEYIYGPPVVSAGGYIWVITERIGVGFLYNFYLYCIDTDGNVVTKYTLEEDASNPNTVGRLSTLSNDVCVVPWVDGLRFYPTGAPNVPVAPSTLTWDHASYGVPPGGSVNLTISENCDYVMVEGGGAGTVTGDGSSTASYVAPATAGTYHILATSNAHPTWTATCTIHVGYQRTVSDASVPHFDAPAVDGSDNIYATFADDTVSPNVVLVLKFLSDNSYDSEWSTGYRQHLVNTAPLCMDGTGIYLAQEDAPHSGSSHVYVNKFNTAGTLLWQYDFGAYSGFVRALPPSVANGKVACYGTDGLDFNTTTLLNATSGALVWSHASASGDNYSNGTNMPPIASDGTVFGGLFSDLYSTPRLSAMNGTTGAELWSVADPDGSSDAPGHPPITGSDGDLQWPTLSLSRTAIADGSEQSRLDAIGFSVAGAQPAFVEGYAYLPIDGASSGVLRAYATSSPLFVWPSNNGLYDRASENALPTANRTVDWFYTLPYTPAGTPGSVVSTDRFTLSADGYTTGSGPAGTVAFDGTDGSDFSGASDPGCLDFAATGAGGGSAAITSNSPLFSFEDIGVPAGAPILTAQLRERVRWLSADPSVTSYVRRLRLYADDNTLLAGQSDGAVPVGTTTWQTMGMSSAASISAPYNVSTQNVYLSVNFDANGAGVVTQHTRADTVELTVEYGATPAIEEAFTSPVAVSVGGYVWALSYNTLGETYLTCLTTAGVLQSRTQILTQAGNNPGSLGYLAVDGEDRCVLVLPDCVQSYATDGTLLWHHGSAASFSPGAVNACVGSDSLIYVQNDFSGTVVVEALSGSTGGLNRSFSTGLWAGANQFALFGTSVYMSMIDPMTFDPVVVKYGTDGTFAWSRDFLAGVGVHGYDRVDYAPSVAGAHVYVTAGSEDVTGNNALVRLADADGSVEWIYDNADVGNRDTPTIGPGGTAYVILDAGATGIAAVNGSGSETWRNVALGSLAGTAPSVGNDGTLLFSLTGSFARLQTADGSVEYLGDARTSPSSAALSAVDSYITDRASAGTLWAYIGGDVPTGGSGRGFRGTNALPKHRTRARAIFSGHGFWGKPQPAPETHCAYWLAYFKGFVNAEDISGGAYGLPTTFEVCDLEDNHLYVFQKAATDINGWAAGRSALFKLERDATDTRDNSGKPQGLYAVEIIYDKA